MTVHDRAAKSPRVSVASFPDAQKNGRGVPGIHDFQENLETCSTVHVAQPYIIYSITGVSWNEACNSIKFEM